MTRKDFLNNGLALGLAPILPSNNVFSESVNSGIDRLTNATGKFELQPLPYAADVLEPYMDAETVNLHHKFHHGGAVNGANKDLQMIQKAIDDNNFETVDFWTKKLAFHFSSHILHTIFWTNLSNKKSEPKGDLLKRIEKDFGSYDKLKGYIAATSKSVDGSGWGIVGYQPYADKLVILQCENHEKLTQWGVIPILVIDVWEHAYYLKYKNNRGQFVDALFNILNWDNVAERLNTATILVK